MCSIVNHKMQIKSLMHIYDEIHVEVELPWLKIYNMEVTGYKQRTQNIFIQNTISQN